MEIEPTITEVLENQMIDLNLKKNEVYEYNGDSKKILSKISFKHNLFKYPKDSIILPENTNLKIEKFNFSHKIHNFEKKKEKIIIENFLKMPASTLGQIITKFKNPKNSVILGTGTLIGPNIVLTSASNICRKGFGNLNFF